MRSIIKIIEFMLVCGTVTFAHADDVSSADKPIDPITEALAPRAQYWPDGELDAFLKKINLQVDSQGKELTAELGEDIALHISMNDRDKLLAREAHPALIELYQQELLYRIRVHLVRGAEGRQIVRQQVLGLLDEWAKAGQQAEPDLAYRYVNAQAGIARLVEKFADDPLGYAFRKSASDEVLDSARQAWADSRKALGTHPHTVEIATAMRRSLEPVLKASAGQMVPEPEAYQAAKQAVAKNREQIDQWRSEHASQAGPTVD